MKTLFFRQKGFTLVELLIYMGLLTIMMVIMTRIFTSILDVQLESEATSFIEEDSRYLFSRLAYDIHRATDIISPANPGEQTSSLLLNMSGVSYVYAINDNTLQLSNDVGAHALHSFGTRVSNFIVKRLGNMNGKNSVQINFTITSTTQRVSGSDSKNVQMTIALR
jgi:type II secretory pathway component PulJ